jgi:regulator of replication initiation timing
MNDLPAWAGTLPGMITAASSSGVFGLVLYAFVKQGPDFLRALSERRQQARAEDAERRGEKRADLVDCHQRLDAMGRRLDTLMTEVGELKLKLLATIAANRMLDLEVETHLPGSTALGQARAILKTAYTLSPSTMGNGAKP